MIFVMDKVIISWSGGKDCALALYELARNDSSEITALLTTITDGYDRISFHGVRRELLELQSQSFGYSLEKIFIPIKSSNKEYEEQMRAVLIKHKAIDVSGVVFGDIFLEDVRAYRVNQLSEIGMKGIFPIWGIDTIELSKRFIDLGFKAIVVCVDTEVLDAEFAGREYDREFLLDLPKSVDPCGENGEFHTFVYDGPIFREKINVVRGENVLRESRFNYCDLVID